MLAFCIGKQIVRIQDDRGGGMAGKVVVLKPMAWNRLGYLRPDGAQRKDGYVAKSGLGHEEWNGDPNRMWKGYRVFHTESTDRMKDWADGSLAIIMTTYKDGGAHALGVAAGVLLNTDEDKAAIVRALRLKEEDSYLWGLPSIKSKHKSLADLRVWWNKEVYHNNWRCLPSHYTWFDTPVPLDPAKLFPPSVQGGKPPDIIKMHGRFMAIRQDQALAVVRNSVDEDSPILEWLSTDDFDESAVSEKTRAFRRPTKAPSGFGGRSAAPTEIAYVRYIREHEVSVSPRHSALQKRFRAAIEAKGALAIAENVAAIDISFNLPGRGPVLGEVKPCDAGETRYAVRTAMGQLLDYRQRHQGDPELLVVVEVKPPESDIALAIENGFAIAYPRAGGFMLRWPKCSGSEPIAVVGKRNAAASTTAVTIHPMAARKST